MLASVAEQGSLSLAWSETPEDMFCRVVAHMFLNKFEGLKHMCQAMRKCVLSHMRTTKTQISQMKSDQRLCC